MNPIADERVSVVRRILSKSFLLAIGLLLVGATPAMADPARPTNYHSQVLRITPATSALKVQVVGGDGFLNVKVAEGHEVLVPSTASDAPPYLRFDKDGTVEENLLSANTYLNNSRYGGTAVPADAQNAKADTPPQWRKVASGGDYSWHDHRIHWMTPNQPPSLGEKSTGKVNMGGPNGDWVVPLIVDGKAVTIYGQLVLKSGVSPLPWLALALVAGGALFLLGQKKPVAAGVGAMLVAGVVALLVGQAQNSAIPPGAGAMVVTVALPAVAVVAAVTGFILRPLPTKVISGLAAVAALAGWVATRYSVLSKAVLPTELSFNLDRAGTAVVIGVAVAAAALLVRSGALTPAPHRVSATPTPGAEPADPG